MIGPERHKEGEKEEKQRKECQRTEREKGRKKERPGVSLIHCPTHTACPLPTTHTTATAS